MARAVGRIATGGSIVLPVDDGVKLTLEPENELGGVTVTYSLVKGIDATAHGPYTTAVTTRTTIDVAGPFYRISVAGGWVDFHLT